MPVTITELNDTDDLSRHIDGKSPASGKNRVELSSKFTAEEFAAASGRQAIRLSAYLESIGHAIVRHGPQPDWIRCEIASITNSGAHRYLTLCESDASGQQSANCRAMVWRSAVPRIFGKFEKVTKTKLTAGMNVLLLVKTNFTARYGLGLTIDDIDPAWTLGDAAKTLEESRAMLKREGLYHLNRSLPAPADYTRMAVIAPNESASLADFMQAASSLEAAGICQTDILPATFEGIAAKDHLVSMMNKVAETPWLYDACCLIRGGGAATSLAWLNHVEIGRRLATMPMPVITGLGHETDKTLLDEIAFESLGTPSKAIGYICGEIYQRARPALDSWRNMPHLVEKHIDDANTDLEIFSNDILQSARSNIALAYQDVDSLIRECINLGPAKTLERGYALVASKAADSEISTLVKSKDQLSEAIQRDDVITITFADGGRDML